MRRWRWATPFVLVLVFLALLGAACGGGDGGGTTVTTRPRPTGIGCTQAKLPATSAHRRGLVGPLIVDRFQTKADHKLTVASTFSQPPFTFMKGGKPAGFDVDLAKEIGTRMKLIVDIQRVGSVDSAVSGVDRGTYDVALSAVPITEEGRKIVKFSDPYFDNGYAFVVNAQKTPALVPEAMRMGMVVGVEKDTAGAGYVQANCTGVEIRPFERAEQALGALAAGRVQAVVGAFPASAYAVATRHEGVLKVMERFETGEQHGIPVAKEGYDGLLGAVNHALRDIEADGTYDEIYERWFGIEPS